MKLAWVTVRDKETGTVCTLSTDHLFLEGLRGKEEDDILNVSEKCIFHSLEEARSKADEFAQAMADLDMLDLYKIQIHVYG